MAKMQKRLSLGIADGFAGSVFGNSVYVNKDFECIAVNIWLTILASGFWAEVSLSDAISTSYADLQNTVYFV